MNTSGKGMKKQHIKFLEWLYGQYGDTIDRISIPDIGEGFGTNPQTTLNYVRRLEKCGVITINQLSRHKRIIKIIDTYLINANRD